MVVTADSFGKSRIRLYCEYTVYANIQNTTSCMSTLKQQKSQKQKHYRCILRRPERSYGTPCGHNNSNDQQDNVPNAPSTKHGALRRYRSNDTQHESRERPKKSHHDAEFRNQNGDANRQECEHNALNDSKNTFEREMWNFLRTYPSRKRVWLGGAILWRSRRRACLEPQHDLERDIQWTCTKGEF